MNKSYKIINMVLITNNKFSEVLKPCKQSLNFPPFSIASKFSSILGLFFLPVLFMRRYQFNATVFIKFYIKIVTVIGFITNYLVWSIFNKPTIYSVLYKSYFVGRSTFNVSGDRKTRRVCNCHDLGTLSAFCFANAKTPFFAGTNVPSIKASLISILPLSYRSCASSFTICLKTPFSTHCWNLLWHVWYGGYLAGRSCQGAPVLNTQRIPFNTSRGSRGFLPLGSFRGVREVITGSILFHCSFVSSILILLHNRMILSRRFYFLSIYFEMACSVVSLEYL